jgi:hypothetical protein
MDEYLKNRFVLRFTVRESGCWEWLGRPDKDGYGIFYVDGKNKKAHRVSYELFRGPIPKGLTIDHLCMNRRCVNPLHLEVVTLKANILRGTSPSARNAKKKSCPQGHPFDEENTYTSPAGGRHCRSCCAARAKIYAQRRKSQRLDG